MRRLALLCALAAPATAHAFCGFFVSGADAKLTNNASQVVLMRKGNRTVMTMSNNYQGPTEDFAMVVPVPVVLQKQDVKTLEPSVFEHIDALSAPRLVEYWEQDPCYVPPPPRSGGGGFWSHRSVQSAPPSVPKPDLGVTVEAKFAVGEYEIVILSAKEANGLETWLSREHYRIPPKAAPALAPYIATQQKFFVAKVNIQKVKRDAHGVVVLSPLRFAFESPELRLPVRLGLINADGKQDLIVYVLHPTSRFEVANYPNVFIPTNLEVVDDVRKEFGTFYAQLFDETLVRMNQNGIVTEYAWQTSSCDPCPVPPLQQGDLTILGDDVLSGAKSPASDGNAPQTPPGGYYGNFASWVLTRLHSRYDKGTLSEDLVFREAGPVVGGRSTFDGTAMELPGEVKVDSTNNFQGRYIIRHYWAGIVQCSNPHWGRWGGPPGGGRSTTPATDLANAPRGGVVLKKVVRSTLPQFDIKGMAPPSHKQ